MMSGSRFDELMQRVGIPAILRQFGMAAVYSSPDGDESPCTAILEQSMEAVDIGQPWPQRMWTVTALSSLKMAAGGVFVFTGDESEYRIEGILSDDGYLASAAVRRDES